MTESRKEKAKMNIQAKETAKTMQLPLPLYESVMIAEAEHEDGARFSIRVGLSEEEAAQLKQLSLDESDEPIQNLTSDRRRFGEGAYEAWYAKGRVPFALIDEESGRLAALLWFGREALGEEPGDWHTIAYRSYPPFRGKGIMKPFTRYVFDLYAAYYPEAKFWAGIHADNVASIGLATALGFKKKEGYVSAAGQRILVKE